MSILNIKLNTDDILAIIGDDPEARLEITTSIAQDFAKRYLKPLVNNELIAKVKKSLTAGVDKKIADQIGNFEATRSTAWGRERVFTISKEAEQKIGQVAEQAIRGVIQEHVDKAVERQLGFMDSKVKSLVDHEVAKRVGSEVDRRMTLAAQG